MSQCNPARTPAKPGQIYTKKDCAVAMEDKEKLRNQGMYQEQYHSVVQSINFLAVITRDDLKFVQGKLAKYTQNPGKEHFKILKHALRFIRGTLDYGIEFLWKAADPAPVDGPLTIEAWSDSSFADDVDTARTTIGSVIKANGATIVATSKLSVRVDSCVNHSELRAFNDVGHSIDGANQPQVDKCTDGSNLAFATAARTVTWARGIKAALERRDSDNIPPTPIYVDNAGVLAMINGRVLKPANRHIYRTLAEARERVHLDRTVKVVKIGTKDNIANAMTKQGNGIDESVMQLRRITGPISIN
jgi:hypothetical protein